VGGWGGVGRVQLLGENGGKTEESFFDGCKGGAKN